MNTERPLPPEAAERDAWLQAALRHAPDAQIEAPPALGALILREARAKAKTPRPARRAAQWWAWLARPSVGAAFASVMVATAVGVLWWDRPLEEHGPRPAAMAEPEAVAPPVTSPTPSPSSPATAATPAPEAAVEKASPRLPAPAAAPQRAPAPKAAEPARREAAARPPSRAPQAAADATVAAAGQAAPRPEAPPPAADPAAPSLRSPEALSAATAVPPPAPPAAPAPTAAAPAAALATESRDLRHRLALAPDSASLADLRASLAVDALRWSWRRGGSAEHAVGDRITGWLAQLEMETGSRWRRAPAAPAGAEDELVLSHQGGATHRLRIASGSVRWETVSPDGSVRRWQAPLEPAAERALRSQLLEATMH